MHLGLEKCVLFSIGTDASNKGNKKFFPIVVRYFCETRGVVDAVLDFYNDSNEPSEAIAHRIKSVNEKNNLSLSSVSSYSADNALVNYGKHSSVYRKPKLMNSYIVQANCNCHVLNNCVKYALKAFTFDVESFVIKTYNSFASCCCCCWLPDPFRGMGAWRKSMEPQKSGNSPGSGPEVVQRVAKE